jgi:hypothetical protein
MRQSTNLSLNNISSQINSPFSAVTAADADAADTGFSTSTAAAEIIQRPPLCVDLLISTKTKVMFLNQTVDIENTYWKIPIIEYWHPGIGVLKKVVKIVCVTREQQHALIEKLATISCCYKEDVIRQIDIQTATITRFKDERKISIGISKKDITACRGKKKNVFYNCFSLVLRISYRGAFKEIHAKIFNTGKIEIPGVINDELLDISSNMILDILQPFMPEKCEYIQKNNMRTKNVLINSNFNCGFYINREKLHNVLRGEKYNMDTSFDPCTYPGVKCKFYYNNDPDFHGEQKGRIVEEDRHLKMKTIITNKKYTEVSIMMFRTGSGLIMGNCSDDILDYIFKFIAKILYDEFYHIRSIEDLDGTDTETVASMKQKNTKLRKKTIFINT